MVAVDEGCMSKVDLASPGKEESLRLHARFRYAGPPVSLMKIS